ncbi:zinc transporter 5-like [Macadamia integrifolia]|uniref:zinc transporter 5-like n=1 Tax=Macadamia integrifolia TaxID=60698 RepID=UPI001C4F0807|nr:zinc transporter 5-like [Macadamia integrifolia]
MDKFQPNSAKMLATFSLLLLLLPILVSADCTCTPTVETGINKQVALEYKIAAIFSILVGGAIGVCLPVLGKKYPILSPENNVFFIIKAFAAGVILATGFIHILPDAFDQLTSPCLDQNPWGNFPFTGFVAMVATILTLMVDSYATSYYTKVHTNMALDQATANSDEEKSTGEADKHATNGHVHGLGALTSEASSSPLIRHRVIAQVLELGILVHSVIIGITIGVSSSPSVVKPLFAALTFHQFFEGTGLGGAIAQARLKTRSIALMGLFFSLTTPIGVIIGIGIMNIYSDSSPTSLIVEGVLDSAAAGILIYMSLVDLLAADFMNSKMQTNVKLQAGACVSLLVGAGCMSVLAIWA